MEMSGFGSQKWILSCISVYVSWKGDRKQKDGPEDVERLFLCCSLCCSTVQYRCDMFSKLLSCVMRIP